MIELKRAVVVPPARAKERVLETGVFDAEGKFCHHAALWRRDVCITVPPKKPRQTSKLSGRWLWGGMLYQHFGHFQVESTARLWAMRRFGPEVEGIVFTPRDILAVANLRSYQKDYLNLLIGTSPIRILTQPTEVEDLVVPGQGFGMGRISLGTRVFRRFVKEDFARAVAPEGPKKLFISRSKQGLNKGGFIGEELLDKRMEAAGYSLFWPEEHSVEEQVAHYKAAKHIVSLDGSALHLFAMVGTKAQSLAIILRRDVMASRSLRQHLQMFTGRKPMLIKALRDSAAVHAGKKRLISELDFDVVGQRLKKGGFISKKYPWQALSEAEFNLD